MSHSLLCWQGCGYTAKNASGLALHVRTHTLPDQRPFDCGKEGSGFTCSESSCLERHSRQHTYEAPRPRGRPPKDHGDLRVGPPSPALLPSASPDGCTREKRPRGRPPKMRPPPTDLALISPTPMPCICARCCWTSTKRTRSFVCMELGCGFSSLWPSGLVRHALVHAQGSRSRGRPPKSFAHGERGGLASSAEDDVLMLQLVMGMRGGAGCGGGGGGDGGGVVEGPM